MLNSKTYLRSASLLSLVLVIAALPLSAVAGIIFRVQQITPTGSILIPGPATFAVTAESDSGNQPVTGIDFTVDLSDTSGKGGLLTGGSNTLFTTGGFFASDFFPAGSGVYAEFSTNDPVGATVTSSPTQVATFTLGTTMAEVVPGTYTISLSSLLVLSGGNQVTSSQVPTQYTVAAVPEPGTLALAGLAAGGLGLTHLARRRSARRQAER